jgi:hypothetical protein
MKGRNGDSWQTIRFNFDDFRDRAYAADPIDGDQETIIERTGAKN